VLYVAALLCKFICSNALYCSKCTYSQSDRPIDREIETKIKLKKKLWKKFIKSKDIVEYNKYKDIRNEVRNNTRQLYTDKQNNIAEECKSNPKMFWNYINSKTKRHNKIGDLYQ